MNHESTCTIVGGGPAGVILAYLLARQNIPVTLLEAHKDFDRDYRGDALIPGVMEIMEELGLADRLLQLRHSKLKVMSYQTSGGTYTITDFGRLKTRYPHMTLLPQASFLEFVAKEAQLYPNFQLVMGAAVQELIEEEGEIRGVRYKKDGQLHDVRSLLTIAADGRFSRIRKMGGFTSIKISAPMDMLCFRLPRKPTDADNTSLPIYIGQGYYLGMWNRFDHWQINHAIPKGSYHKLYASGSAGIEELKKSVSMVIPEFADRVGSLEDWSQVSYLPVESSRVKRWYRSGLLLIGDAAHVMSPVGGVGINCAIQDAVVASNVLSKKLKSGKLTLSDLAEVQRRRRWPTRIMQFLQFMVEKRLIARALDPDKPFKMPPTFRFPFIRNLASRVTGFGIWRVHVEESA